MVEIEFKPKPSQHPLSQAVGALLRDVQCEGILDWVLVMKQSSWPLDQPDSTRPLCLQARGRIQRWRMGLPCVGSPCSMETSFMFCHKPRVISCRMNQLMTSCANAGQGMNTALEDGAVLAWHLQHGGLCEEAMRAFERERIPRVKSMAEQEYVRSSPTWHSMLCLPDH